MRVLVWNLKHGRAVPPAGRDLFDEFAAALGGWEWDVALLQEVPPWWPDRLAGRLGATAAHVLTSRNAGRPVRRILAERWPEVMKSNGGGANAILLRGARVTEYRQARLGWWPERRWVHAVRAGRMWVANTHLQGSLDQAERAGELVRGWAGGAATVFGGDFNVRSLRLEGFEVAAENGVDYVFVSGMAVSEPGRALEPGRLSDHVPITAGVRAQSSPRSR